MPSDCSIPAPSASLSSSSHNQQDSSAPQDVNGNNHNTHHRPHHQDTTCDVWLDYLRQQHPLPPWLEVVLSWMVAMMCLLYYFYSYVSSVGLSRRQTTTAKQHDSSDFFPLVTQPKGAVETQSTQEMYTQVLEKLGSVAVVRNDENNENEDAALVAAVRDNVDIRRLLSSIFVRPDVATVVPNMDRWKRLWPKLLALPSVVHVDRPHTDTANPNSQRIALILPAFREDGRHIVRTLTAAMEHAHNSTDIQIIVVHASGSCSNMDQVDQYIQQYPLSQIVPYANGGGRGPTLHYGTQFVADHVVWLTFVHSDTLLPVNWDVEVRKAWHSVPEGQQLQATAFCFGHDLSAEGLQGGPYPHGISAVWLLGNTRAYTSALPYGDHVLTIPLSYYRYVGGFPAQPIMEDYEIMDYWRRRAAVVKKCYGWKERISILPRAVHTGVRRWQKHGVVYVTLVNALIVYRYQRGWRPQDVFWYYYERPSSSPTRSSMETASSKFKTN